MEHPADIRHRAGSIEGYVDFERAVECNHVNESDLEWLKQTVIDLADELERLRRPPASIPSSAMGLGCDVDGGCAWSADRCSIQITNDQWDELLDVPRRAP